MCFFLWRGRRNEGVSDFLPSYKLSARHRVPREDATARAAAMLKRFNVPERLWSLPPATFSGGEQQRINLARGLLPEHPVLLLDEPTASLDANNRAVVIDIVRERKRQGAAIVAIVHDDEVREAIVLLARTEGIFTETAGGTTVGVLKKLVESGQLDPALETVVINTGHGLKTLESVSGMVGPAATIDPSYAAFTNSGIV